MTNTIKNQDNQNAATSIVTNPVRLSYANIWEPRSINGSEEKYSASLLISKDDKLTLDKVEKAVNAAIQRGVEKFGKAFKSGKIKTPLRDGDEDRPDDENYEGHFFLNANAQKNQPPKILDLNRREIEDEDEVYSGCYARASLSFYPFNTGGNKGVAVGLNGLQKVKDGDRLSGRVNASEAFDDGYEPEFDDDDFLN